MSKRISDVFLIILNSVAITGILTSVLKIDVSVCAIIISALVSGFLLTVLLCIKIKTVYKFFLYLLVLSVLLVSVYFISGVEKTFPMVCIIAVSQIIACIFLVFLKRTILYIALTVTVTAGITFYTGKKPEEVWVYILAGILIVLFLTNFSRKYLKSNYNILVTIVSVLVCFASCICYVQLNEPKVIINNKTKIEYVQTDTSVKKDNSKGKSVNNNNNIYQLDQQSNTKPTEPVKKKTNTNTKKSTTQTVNQPRGTNNYLWYICFTISGTGCIIVAVFFRYKIRKKKKENYYKKLNNNEKCIYCCKKIKEIKLPLTDEIHSIVNKSEFSAVSLSKEELSDVELFYREKYTEYFKNINFIKKFYKKYIKIF